VHANAASFAADGGRVALVGHSTGAEMVAEVGTTPALQAASGGMSCVAALDGAAYDLVAAMAQLGAAARATYRAAYGTTPARWATASAVTYARPDHRIAPFLVVLRGGERGVTRPLQQELVDRLRAAGVAVQTVDARSIGHGQVVTNIGRAGDTVMTPPMTSFLQRCR
jgi:arylformamidase